MIDDGKMCLSIRGRAACEPTETQLGSLAAFQVLLGALSSEEGGATLRLTGVNLQLVSGSGSSYSVNPAPTTTFAVGAHVRLTLQYRLVDTSQPAAPANQT